MKIIKLGVESIDKYYEIELSLEEMLILDGKVSEKAQKKIDSVKKESSYGFNDFPFLNEVIRKSEEIGTLKWTQKSIRSCSFCDKKYDYQRYTRSGRYHSKGDKNLDKPLYYSGIKFNEGFITITGHGDMCTECCSKHKVIERLVKYILDNDLKIQIMKNQYGISKYLKDDIKICYSCNSEMKESEMSRESTLMGNGSFPSGCPKCGAKSSAFGNNHKITNKFDFTLNLETSEEACILREFIKQFNLHRPKEEHLSLFQGNINPHVFTVKENKWSNGHTEVIRINLKKKLFEVGYFYKNKIDELKLQLEAVGMTEGQLR